MCVISSLVTVENLAKTKNTPTRLYKYTLVVFT